MVNIETRTVKKGKKYLIKNGIPEKGVTIDTSPVTVSELENLYQVYKRSLPVEGKRIGSKYFKALSLDELSDEDLIKGEPRAKAAYELESKIVIGVLNGSLTWDCFTKDENKWFWVSPTDKDLVILKEWITGGNQK